MLTTKDCIHLTKNKNKKHKKPVRFYITVFYFKIYSKMLFIKFSAAVHPALRNFKIKFLILYY